MVTHNILIVNVLVLLFMVNVQSIKNGKLDTLQRFLPIQDTKTRKRFIEKFKVIHVTRKDVDNLSNDQRVPRIGLLFSDSKNFESIVELTKLYLDILRSSTTKLLELLQFRKGK